MTDQLRASMINRSQRKQRQRPNHGMNPILAMMPGAGVFNPIAPQLNTNLERFIIHTQDEGKVGGTAKAFDPKIIEWEQYCELKFPNDANKYHLNCDKLYPFMFYQAFREQKTRGKNTDQKFNNEECDTMMNGFIGQQVTQGLLINPPYPTNPISGPTFDQYKAVFKYLHRQAVATRATSLVWEHIWQDGLTSLGKLVKERKPLLKRQNCEEKHNGEFAPCVIAEKHEEIESHMWKDSAEAIGNRSVVTQLRHRYCFGHLTSAILRCETLCSAELSDFLGISPPKKDTDIHTPHIMINQIAQGKTNHGRILYGRSTRHSDVRLCCIGALAFYLQHRFFTAHEFEQFTVDDWLDNTKWFFIKLLVDVQNPDNTQPLKNDSYGEHITLVLNKLGLPNNKKLHLGRNVGTKKLDLCEVTPDEIKRMGNWNPSVFDNSHSSKVPMVAIRAMAGFSGNKKFYCVPRTAVEPPDSLLRSTPMGKWCYDAYEAVKERDPDGKKITAQCVLKFMCEVNKVSAQDAAAMAVLHEDREKHPLFNDVPAFKSEEFKVFKRAMKRELDVAEDPFNAKLEMVLPGVQQWHNSTNQSIESTKTTVGDLALEVQRLNTTMEEGFKSVRQENRNSSKAQARTLATAFMSIAETPLKSKGDDVAAASELMDLEDSIEDCLDSSGSDCENTPPSSPTTTFGANDLNLNQVSPSPPPVAPATRTRRPKPVRESSPELLEQASKLAMQYKHLSLSDLWEEWHGTGAFADEFGGIVGRNKLFGKTWRKGYKKNEKQHYSRTSRVVEAIQTHAARFKVPELEAVALYEDMFTKSGRGVASMVKKFQDMNLLKKQKPRGRKST